MVEHPNHDNGLVDRGIRNCLVEEPDIYEDTSSLEPSQHPCFVSCQSLDRFDRAKWISSNDLPLSFRFLYLPFNKAFLLYNKED